MIVRKLRNNKGASAVEFALVILIFSIFVFSIIDFGWYFFCQHSVGLATREGSRVGVVRGDDDSITQEIRDRASIAVDPNDLNINFNTDSTTNATTVTTQYTHHFFSPLIGAFFSGGSTVIEVEAAYRIEPEPYVPPS